MDIIIGRNVSEKL